MSVHCSTQMPLDVYLNRALVTATTVVGIVGVLVVDPPKIALSVESAGISSGTLKWT